MISYHGTSPTPFSKIFTVDKFSKITVSPNLSRLSKQFRASTQYNFSPCRTNNCNETSVSIVHETVLELYHDNYQSYLPKSKKNTGIKKNSHHLREGEMWPFYWANATGDICTTVCFPNNQRLDTILKMYDTLGSIYVAEENGWISAHGFIKVVRTICRENLPYSDRISPFNTWSCKALGC